MIERKTVYFSHPGAENSENTLRLAAERASQNGIGKALIASTSGKTGLLALNILENMEVIVVTHSYGFKEVNRQEFTAENREAIEGRGGKILTCQHAFGGVGRAVRKKFDTYELEEIIAQTLRTFGEGTKVCMEITLMATDAGLVNAGEILIAIAGTDSGADTALVIKAANAQSFFDLRVQEIICKPWLE
jgi:hypothetical protein